MLRSDSRHCQKRVKKLRGSFSLSAKDFQFSFELDLRCNDGHYSGIRNYAFLPPACNASISHTARLHGVDTPTFLLS